MTELGAATGRLKALSVEIDGKLIMTRGEFAPVKSNIDVKQYRYR